MISVTGKGDLSSTRNFLKRLAKLDAIYSELDRFGREGVSALARATPKASGETANSWAYRIIKGRQPGIEWYNTHITVDGIPVAILIQYGHGTGTGGYVPAIDFINPVMQPIFDRIADEVWKKVKL